MTLPPTTELMETSDGSHTLYRPDINETYHSQYGALQESRYIFIERGLKPSIQRGLPGVRLMEVGLGTGLNILLTALEARQTPDLWIEAISLEPFPISSVLAQQLNYPALLPQHPSARLVLDAIHHGPWEEGISLSPNFSFRKIQKALEDFQPEELTLDLIYFDAFAPQKQAEVWASANLRKCADLLAPGGMLITYCAQGQFKRELKAAGLLVEPLPGPPGKRSITRALKPPAR